MHLDPALLRTFLSRPEAFPELAAHLATPCERCEEVLAQASTAELEGAVDAALAALRAQPLPADDAGFERVRAQLSPRRRRPALLVGALGVAAALAFGVSSLFLPQAPAAPTEPGVKGGGVVQAPLALSVAARLADGTYTPVGEGDGVASSASLVFQYDAVAPTDAELLLEREGKPAEHLLSLRLEPGRHDLTSREGVVAMPLSGERGPVRLVLQASDGSRAALELTIRP